MFYLYEGNTRDLPTDENHLNFRWSEEDILFSVTQRGNAASIHFTASNMRRIKEAVEEFCQYIFDTCDWCKMIIGAVKDESIVRLGLKCGFDQIAFNKDVTVMMRLRRWES